jgi:hypothetical protein
LNDVHYFLNFLNRVDRLTVADETDGQDPPVATPQGDPGDPAMLAPGQKEGQRGVYWKTEAPKLGISDYVDPQVHLFATELQPAVPQHRAGKQPGLEQDLKSVADSEHGAAAVRERLERLNQAHVVEHHFAHLLERDVECARPMGRKYEPLEFANRMIRG